MSIASHIPKPIDGDPIHVIEKIIRQVDCPNPQCDQVLDITNINEGTKIQCEACKNVTWVPAYEPKWWQKTKVILGGLAVSFVVGILSSLVATSIYAKYAKTKPDAQTNIGVGADTISAE